MQVTFDGALVMQSDKSVARQWARHTAFLQELNHPPHTTPAQFLLARGELFTRRRLTRARGIKRACYYNAYRLARRRGYRYVEGIAVSIIPLEHAWCVDRDRNVIEPTWDEKCTPDYFGVAFDLGFVARMRKLLGRESFSVLWTWWRWRDLWPHFVKEFKL